MNRPRIAAWLTTTLVALVALAPAVAQPPPPTDGARPLFDYREITLDNGLKVVTLEDFSCPIVNLQLWYHVGSKNEDPQRQGFAHMFEHMMFRGTERLAAKDHTELIRRVGGQDNAYTAFDQTVYHETVPANQLELALWLEAERMSFLKIDQEAFDTERQVVEEERRLGVNRPYGTLPEKALAELFKEHPYRWSPIGCIPHLRAASVAELREFWTRYYVPNNATLVMVGAVKHETAQELARKYFGWIPRCPEPPRVTVQEPPTTQPRQITIKEDNAPSPIVGVVFHTVPTTHPDEAALELLGTILGGGESSRIYRELVAEKQLAAMAIAGSLTLEQAGIFGAAAVLMPVGGDEDQVQAALEAQISRLREEPVSERELLKARNQKLAELVTRSLQVASRASALGAAAVIEGDTARVNRQLAEVRRVTADDLLRVARTYLAPERAITIRVERNMLGSLGSMLGFQKNEEEPPITAEPELEAPPPGRAGVERPAGYPDKPPLAPQLDCQITPRFERAELPNGLKVLVVENHKAPFVTAQLAWPSGAWTEQKPGTASMALNMLTKGTATHSEGELADELETYAISLSGYAGMDDSSVYLSTLSEQVDRAMELMAEVVLTPTFPAEEFEKLRQQVITGLTISTSEPSYIAGRELRKRLYGDHPYARTATGEVADVETLTVEDVRDWWKRFARPDQATLIFAGDIKLARALALAEAAFGDWKANEPATQVAVADIPPPQATQIYLVNHPGVQSQIRVGQLGITRQHPGYFTSRVINGYFGGAFGSRLNETIRVVKGASYGAHGGYDAQRMAGQFEVSTFTKNERVAETVRTIFEEIDRLRKEQPSADELEITKTYTLGSFPGQRETPQAVAADLWLIQSHDLPADYLEQLLKGVAATKAEDCTRLVEETIDPAKMVVVVVGPADELKADLEKIAPVTVVEPETGQAQEPDSGR